ncbi:uncharacterized protein METZ01_LOCUS102026 [marine metagenome]|uniref:Uncharacterized protein n=1 Tax=marine metagenome TaxID=408172 RepID=A0A381W9N0_9ZZZZ
MPAGDQTAVVLSSLLHDRQSIDRGVDPIVWRTGTGDLYQIPNAVYQLRNGLATARGDIDFAVTVCSLPNGATSARIVTAR